MRPADVAPSPLPADQVLPPLGYGAGWWFAVGGALVLGVVALVLAVWLFRHRPPADAEPVRRPRRDPRRVALGRIARIARDYDAGALGERAAHQELSLVVRRFAGARLGIPVENLTLTDLRSAGGETGPLEQVARYVAAIYDPEFGVLGTGSVPDAVAEAKNLVAAWN